MNLNSQNRYNVLLGDSPDESLVALLSTEKQVTEDTPPTILWHAADDGNVPVENCLLFAGALSCHQVPFDLHAFESGGYGLDLAEGHPEVKAWLELYEAWLRKRNFL
ncbi:prolyl oligopeptidase family serine peptidase [Paenibacillus sp. N4]|uniref:alpha/beta hydrolase n=1 Tax=Paenibacillus vietnamensis TaxID=2590547 RepID=UPI001CD1262D|nr:prolyl oligopeptidase family serine peptidase [Paenibacillus vietnamensis]MCA0758742.1 prolyl oligopeptidase family serine peptidase [Paenibacillus vietnamensis]